MDVSPPEPTLHIEDHRRGRWSVRISRRGSLEAMAEQMMLIDRYRGGDWPQRITDDSGKVLLQNDAARRLGAGTGQSSGGQIKAGQDKTGPDKARQKNVSQNNVSQNNVTQKNG